MAVHMQVRPNQDASQTYGSVSILVNGNPVIGFQVDLNGHFTLTGSGAADVAKALHQIGTAANKAGKVLKDAYNQTADQATGLLKNASYTAQEVGHACRHEYLPCWLLPGSRQPNVAGR